MEVEQINRAIAQQGAAPVQQASAAARPLQAQAGALAQTVGVFRLKGRLNGLAVAA